MTLWKIREFHYLLYLNLNGREQRFSDGYQEQTCNNDDVGWTVMNSGSAMGNGKRCETMTMLDEQSWTVVQQWVPGRDVKQWRCWMNSHKQSTLVMTYPQGCPVKNVCIWRSFKLRFKVIMELLSFKLCLFQFYCIFLTHLLANWVEFRSFEQFPFHLHKCLRLSHKEIILIS